MPATPCQQGRRYPRPGTLPKQWARKRLLTSLALLLSLGFVLVVESSGQQAGPATPKFVDVTQSAGIQFHLTCGTAEKLYIMDALCGGTAFLDYDNDGWLDILMVNGSTHEARDGSTAPASKLYHNKGDGTFADVTEKAGLTRRGWGMGVAVGDYNNDGWADFYITYYTGGALYQNNGDGTFTDVTAKSGAGNLGRWGTSAAFGDYNKDGFLDLYIANYVDVDPDKLPQFGSAPNCQYRGIPVSCGPRGLKGARDRLYRNNGDGTFADVTETLNIDSEGYYGLGVIWGDYNRDGWPDIYVANDSSPSLLYRNNGQGGFTEVGLVAGVAYSDDGREQAGMGVDFGDYDNDGWPDLVKTNFSDDSNNLYHNGGDGFFEDRGGPAGLAPMDIPFLAFGVRFFDYDNDGWKDLVVANGHVNPQVDGHAFGVTYGQRNFLYRNLGNGRFQETGKNAGAAFQKELVSRGVATGDFDNDGALDLLVSDLDGQPQLLRNDGRGAGRFLRIRLIGVKSNRDGIGARVVVTTGRLTQTDEARANSSYLSASESTIHFGLGSASRFDQILINWPSGTVDKIEGEGSNNLLTIREGEGVIARTPIGQRPNNAKQPPRR